MTRLAELDQAPDQEARTLRTLERQLQAIQRRYPASHPVKLGMDTLLESLWALQAIYAPYLDPRYEVTDG